MLNNRLKVENGFKKVVLKLIVLTLFYLECIKSQQTMTSDSVISPGTMQTYKYPIIVGGYDDHHYVEGFRFDGYSVAFAVKTCSKELTGEAFVMRWYVA